MSDRITLVIFVVLVLLAVMFIYQATEETALLNTEEGREEYIQEHR